MAGMLADLLRNPQPLPKPPQGILGRILADLLGQPRPGTPAFVDAIWRKASAIEGYNEDVVRRDVDGHWIARDRYGDQESPFGWHIDHRQPLSTGGSEDLSNCQPRRWLENIATGNRFTG